MTDEATATLCEIASLYALDALDDAEARRFENHLVDGCPACRRELDEIRGAVDLLAVAARPAEPPPSLRGRIMDVARQSRHDRQAPSSAAGFDDDGPWRPYSVPGIDYRMLHLDREAREIVMLVRAQPGAQYPDHHHAAPEDMFMLRGELLLDGVTYRPGDFIRSTQGSQHGVGDTLSGCMFLMRGSIDDLVFASGDSGSFAPVPRPRA